MFAISRYLYLLLWPALLTAAEFRGTVRAADQWVPGAAVAATLGDTKIAAFTDERGRYVLDLTPGTWDIQVEMFGFSPARERVTIGSEPVVKEWTLEMPRLDERSNAAAPVAAPAPAPTRPVVQ